MIARVPREPPHQLRARRAGECPTRRPPRGYERFLLAGAERYLRSLRATPRDLHTDNPDVPFVEPSPLIGD